MNYLGRINVIVKSPEVWEKLADMNTSDVGLLLPPSELFRDCDTQWVLDEEYGWKGHEFQASALCRYITSVAPDECLIICDTTDLEKEQPLHFCYWYAGGPYVSAYTAGYSFQPFDNDYEDDGRSNMREMTDIHDIAGWFKYLGLASTKGIKEYLAGFDIEL